MVIPEKVHILIPRTVITFLEQGSSNMCSVNDLEMRRSSWIIHVGPTFNDKCPCKRKAEGGWKQKRRNTNTQGTRQREDGGRS